MNQSETSVGRCIPIQQMLSSLASLYTQAGWKEPLREAERLLAEYLGCSYGSLYATHAPFIAQEESVILFDWLERTLRGEPLAYISGTIEFAGCIFAIGQGVLIPRPETELLFDKVSQRLTTQQIKGRRVWDLCCGSGCLGIALKKKHPELDVWMSDLSDTALDYARFNRRQNGVAVSLVKGDFCEPIPFQSVDYLICNPPYISLYEYHALDPSVRVYEPKEALLGGESGDVFYEKLAHALPVILCSGGFVALEIGGSDQRKRIQSFFEKGPWKKIWIEEDWAGLERFFFLEKE